VEAEVVKPATARALATILQGVVEAGTGTQARIEGYSVAGKTGTAQKVDPGTGRYHPRARMSSFVGFAPVQDPRLAALVLLDTPRRATYGGVVAAPAFRRIVEFGLTKLRVQPTFTEEQLDRRPVEPATLPPLPDVVPASFADAGYEEPDLGALLGRTPRFLGQSAREALVRAQREGFTVHFEGSGYVVAQHPPAGSERVGEDLFLRLGEDG
jgi:cell division protein FtsI (penicillin-binding protein 3)